MRKAIKLIFLCILFCGCRKEISLPLESDEDQIVIEATIKDTEKPKIEINKTQSVLKNGWYNGGVKNAKVYIINSHGQKMDFEEPYDGEYEPGHTDFDIKPGITFTLYVIINGKTYTAVSKMPFPVSLDSVSVTESPISISGSADKNYALTPRYKDPKGAKNYYRFIFDYEHSSDKNIYLLNDNQSDGIVNRTSILSLNVLYYGQILKVEMQSIDEATYDYFYGLRQNTILGQVGGPTPADPVSNIKGGALGYFSAYSTSKKEIQIR